MLNSRYTLGDLESWILKCLQDTCGTPTMLPPTFNTISRHSSRLTMCWSLWRMNSQWNDHWYSCRGVEPTNIYPTLRALHWYVQLDWDLIAFVNKLLFYPCWSSWVKIMSQLIAYNFWVHPYNHHNEKNQNKNKNCVL